jgi:hypothetical protein
MNQVDFAIVPITTNDFDVLDTQEIENVFIALEFRKPIQGETFWRIPGYLTVAEVNEKKTLTVEAFEGIRRSIEIPIDERERERMRELEEEKELDSLGRIPRVTAENEEGNRVVRENEGVKPKEVKRTEERPERRFDKSKFTNSEAGHQSQDSKKSKPISNTISGEEGNKEKTLKSQKETDEDELRNSFERPILKTKKLRKLRDSEENSAQMQPTLDLGTQDTEFVHTIRDEEFENIRLNKAEEDHNRREAQNEQVPIASTLVIEGEDNEESYL